MKRLLATLLPGFIKRPLSRSRTTAQARREHERLAGFGAHLDDRHVANLRVLTSREKLLDLLPKHAVAAEVGVARGGFSQQILARCEPQRLHLIDAWASSGGEYGPADYQHVTEKFQAHTDSGQVVIHRGWSWDMLAQLPDASLDWVYLDAGHRYDMVSRDLRATRPKMKPVGLICGHDYVKWSSIARNCY